MDKGVVRAVDVIGRKIDELESSGNDGGGSGGRLGLLKGVDRWIPGWKVDGDCRISEAESVRYQFWVGGN
ncbi:hypothetical protein LINPERHAP1_LOCUS18067 [Linum perenne]